MHSAMDLNTAKQKLLEKLEILASGTFLVEGPTLVGKTILLQQLKSSLENSDSRTRFVRIFTCSQLHVGYEPLLESVEELSKRKNWLPEKRAGRLACVTGVHVATMITGLFRRFFPDAIPNEIFDGLRDALGAAVSAHKNSLATLEFPRSEKSKLIGILQDTIAKSGRRLVLFVDRVEELPTPGIRLLQLVAESSPENVVLVLSANSESTAYFERQDIRELANVCRKKGTEGVYQIEGYSAESLLEMRRSNGFETTLASAENAYKFTRCGLIGLAAPWLNSADDNAALLKPGADQLSAHYAIQYDRLEDKHKTLIKCLGAVYPEGLSIRQVADCLVCSVSNVENELRNVVGIFGVISGQVVSLRDKHVLYFLRSNVSSAFIQAAYEEFQSRVGGPSLLATSPGTYIPPASQMPVRGLPPSLTSMDAQTLLSQARDDLARGAGQAAMSRLDAWRGWGNPDGQAPEITGQLLLLEADALGQLGAYDQAIERLLRVPSVMSLTFEASISLGEKYYRVGLHGKALQSFSRARRESRRQGACDAWVKATARTLSTRNELSSGTRSRLLADRLAELLRSDDASVTPRSRSLAYRTLARTFALIPARRDIALNYAENSLDIALTETKSSRDEGNSRYALADVYRHIGNLERAVHEYQIAHELGKTTGNYDLALYALLGKAACWIASGSASSLRNTLGEIEILATNANDLATISWTPCLIKRPFELQSHRVTGS